MPDMKTEMQKVVIAGSLKYKPLNERIWLWLLDHPRASAKAIAAALKERREMVQCNLTNLKNRAMVYNTPSDLRGARSTDVLWSVSQAMHGKFELLPVTKKAVAKISPQKPALPVVESKPTEQNKNVCEINVELLTLQQAKRLYDQLKEFFG